MGTDQWRQPDEGVPEPVPGTSATPGPAAASGWGTPSPAPAGGPQPSGQRGAAPRPGIVPLRPLGLGEIWDGAFRAFRQNPRVMVGLSAVVVVLTSFVTLVATYATTRDLVGALNRLEAADGGVEDLFSSLQRTVPLLVLTSLLQAVAVLVLNGMLIVSVSRAVLGRTIGFGELWRTCRRRLPPLVGLSLVITLSTTVVGALALAPGILLVVFADSDVVTGVGVVALLLGLLLWLAAGTFLWVKWSMATPAMLLEGLGVGASLRRSAALTKRSFWRTFGILLLTTIVTYVVVTAVAVPFSAVGQLLAVGLTSESSGLGLALSQTVSTLGSIVGSVVAYPFLASVTALLYVDLRMRREGLDVELHRAIGR
jgi:hypothetical protein